MKNYLFFGARGWMSVLTALAMAGTAAAQNIVMENYRVKGSGGDIEIIYKGKCALILGYTVLNRKGTKEGKIDFHAMDIKKVVAKDGYQEINFSNTWEKAGFSCEARTRLYPKKVEYRMFYKFTNAWEGNLYISPFIDPSLVIGAKYRATDEDGLVSEEIIEGAARRYICIPSGVNLKAIEIWPAGGGKITYRVEEKNPLRQNPRKNLWAGICLLLNLKTTSDKKASEAGIVRDIRLNLRQIPPNELFPAGYTNEIIVEAEFE